jgi:hypothetical protein
MSNLKHITFFVAVVALLFSCKPKQTTSTPTGVKNVAGFDVSKLQPFFAYPVSKRKPIIIDTGKPEEDKKIYNLRLQHWYLIYNTKEYEKMYGALPDLYPGNVTLQEYKKNPPRPPDEYDRVMFGK